MDLTVNEYIEGLLTEEAHRCPSDKGRIDELEKKMHLPEWFDEEKFNQGRRFSWDFVFMFGVNMTLGLVAVLSVPSILKILVRTRRSNSTYTAYKRYISTLMHVHAWHDHNLKPGTKSWRSLLAVRTRHLRAGKKATLKGHGTVSQRDLALTQFGFIGYAVLAPDKFSLRQLRTGDWEGYNHFWRTIGYMIGLEDRYNLCRKKIDETREACRVLMTRVFTPCLTNPPEYFEHTARAMLEGLDVVVSNVEPRAALFLARCYADVPGYVFSESDRIAFQKRLREHLKGKSEDVGVHLAALIPKCAVEGLPNLPSQLLHVRDFDVIETTPAYKQLNFKETYRLAFVSIGIGIYNTYLGRSLVNFLYRLHVLIVFYFPYKAFTKFGIKKSFVNMFKEDPKDNTAPKLNSEYYKPPQPDTWYGKLWTILW